MNQVLVADPVFLDPVRTAGLQGDAGDAADARHGPAALWYHSEIAAMVAQLAGPKAGFVTSGA